MGRLKEELRLLNYGDKGKMQKDHGEPCSKLPSFQDRAHGQLEQEEEHNNILYSSVACCIQMNAVEYRTLHIYLVHVHLIITM